MTDIEDEYDAYYSPLDLQGVRLSPSPEPAPTLEPSQATLEPNSQLTTLDTPGDEFDVYDLSEFTAEDLAQIDAAIHAASPPPAVILASGTLRGGTHGGPDVEIQLEEHADSSALVKAQPHLRDDHPEREAHLKSPFELFRSRNKSLSVSDLVGPAWCEVQFDYGLRGKRYLKPEQRPKSFVSNEGKDITTDKSVAENNHRVISRGHVIHKALEREIRPEEVKVEVSTQEDRWGLRLVNMLACLGSLLDSGICREMPVFGVVHGELVVGVVDELVRRPVSPPISKCQSPRSDKDSSKRESPSSPSKGASKKSRTTPLPSQPLLTSYFHMAVQVPEIEAQSVGGASAFAMREAATCKETKAEPSTPKAKGKGKALPAVLEESDMEAPQEQRWTLHISDTKTRRSGYLPPREDTLSSRLQLMLYHRLLSSLLAPSLSSSSPPSSPSKAKQGRLRNSRSQERSASRAFPLDFAVLWTRLGLDPAKPFSRGFRRDAGLLLDSGVGHLECLNDLVGAWRSAVRALALAVSPVAPAGVDTTLTLVYRRQLTKEGKELPTRKREGMDRGMREREAEELARAIEASLNEAPRVWAGADEELAKALGESLRNADGVGEEVPGAAPDTLSPGRGDLDGQPDHTLALPRDMQSELRGDEGKAVEVDAERNGEEGANDEEEGPPMAVEDLDVEARILGSRRFSVRDRMLDRYLESVLRWWHGQRPPRGVGIELTRRCLNCEYMEGCEWRAKKAMDMTTGDIKA